MTLPTRLPLNEVLSIARNRWTQTKNAAQAARTASAGGAYPAHRALALYDQLRADSAFFEAISGTPGLPDYARQVYSDAGIDVVADFGTMRAAIDSAVTWLLAALPRDASGFIALHEERPDGSIGLRSFTPTQTAGLRTRLDAILAVIE